MTGRFLRLPRTRAATLNCAFLGAVLASTLSGCATIGTRVLPADRIGYNEAAAASTNEQLLLNILRVNEGKAISFVEISSMISQLNFEATGNGQAQWNNLHGIHGPALRAAYPVMGDDTIEPRSQKNVSGSLEYSDTPTISYRNLEGGQFAEQVVAPIPPVVLLYLSQCGWSIDRLLECCVQRINGLENASLDDDSIRNPVADPGFIRAAFLFRRLQSAGKLQFGVVTESDPPQMSLFLPTSLPGLDEELRELRTLLDYPADGDLVLRLTPEPICRKPDEIGIETRSLMATIHALTRESLGRPKTSREVSPADTTTTQPRKGPWLRIERSLLPPRDPFVRIWHEGRWYFIEKSDWSSKRTFSMLTALMSTKLTNMSGAAGPILTVGAGGR